MPWTVNPLISSTVLRILCVCVFFKPQAPLKAGSEAAYLSPDAVFVIVHLVSMEVPIPLPPSQKGKFIFSRFLAILRHSFIFPFFGR